MAKRFSFAEYLCFGLNCISMGEMSVCRDRERQREILFRRNRKKKVLLRHLEDRWTDEHKEREREGGKLNTSISELLFRRL